VGILTSAPGKEITEVEAKLVQVGKTIYVLVEGVGPFDFESRSYEWDLGMLTSWHKQETGNDTSPAFAKLCHDLAVIWHSELESEGGESGSIEWEVDAEKYVDVQTARDEISATLASSDREMKSREKYELVTEIGYKHLYTNGCFHFDEPPFEGY
jgi:hypothetical protein